MPFFFGAFPLAEYDIFFEVILSENDVRSRKEHFYFTRKKEIAYLL